MGQNFVPDPGGPGGPDVVPVTPQGGLPDEIAREVSEPTFGVIHENVDAKARGTVSDAPENFDVSECEIETSSYNEAAIADLKTYHEPDSASETPKPFVDGSEISVSINGDRLIQATVQQSFLASDGLIHTKAYDQIRHMKNSYCDSTYSDTRIRSIFESIAEEIEVPHVFDFSENFQDRANLPGANVSLSTQDVSGVNAMNRLVSAAGGYWWIDLRNRLVYSDTLPTTTYELEYVKDAFAGDALPPYQQVVVYGKPETANSGNLSKNPTRGSAGSGQPKKVYRDNTIRSDAQAEAVAKNMLEQYQNQSKDGTITLPGHAKVRPMDIIVEPDIAADDRVQGRSYLASRLKHKLSARDGFETEVTVGGLPKSTNS
jgi:hypothetical protein